MIRRGILTLCLAAGTTAWNYQGHMTIAGVAQSLLTDQELTAVTIVLDLYREPCRGNISYDSFTHPLVECAVYADQIKHRGGLFQSNWHFIDQMYNASNGLQSDSLLVGRRVTVVTAIKQLVQILDCKGLPPSLFLQQSAPCGRSLPVYTALEKFAKQHCNCSGRQLDENAKGLAMRLLIHYVGDVSQPLHTINRVSKQFPVGDMGGNLFNISSPAGFKSITELHALWDSAMYKDYQVMKTPLSSDDWQTLIEDVQVVRNQHDIYVKENPSLVQYDPVQWAADSFAIGKRLYDGVAFNQSVSQQYIDDWQVIAKQQQVVAGHRLASVIKRLLSNQVWL